MYPNPANPNNNINGYIVKLSNLLTPDIYIHYSCLFRCLNNFRLDYGTKKIY